ncbi:MAG: hypothetical protein CML01_11570 [Pseudomonas sp.]|nr:hypothetical protein [Pseudomonas sp.]|tara:strand:- start:38812 stop:39018 length:207 start_codon:yes stop_codon:yes gene_type:complete
MAKRYKVLERAFINGRLCEPGDVVSLEIDSPGSHLEEVKAEPKQDKAKPGQKLTAKPEEKPEDNLPDA